MPDAGEVSVERDSTFHEAHRVEAPGPRVSSVIIGFSTPRGFNLISWLIRKVTGSRTSHAWLLVYDPVFKLRMVMEAHSTGMRLVPLTVFEKTNVVVAQAHPRVDFSRALQNAGRWLGEKYDFTGLLGMAWVLLGRWIRRKWRNPFNDSRALFCSEAVVQTLRSAEYPHIGELQADSTSPEDLLDFLQDSPFECPIEFTDQDTARRRRRWRRRSRNPAHVEASSAQVLPR